MAVHKIVDHNRAAAAAWDAGAIGYNHVSFTVSDALAHAAQRLTPIMGERVLDVATGTGWSARNVARMGAVVTAVDIAPALLQAAQALSGQCRPPIDYRVADAECLPFADGEFDKVISTFGVMFAADQMHAALELGRVCRKGGRLCLATWTPDGSVARFFAVLGAYRKVPPPPASPLLWGDQNHLETLLGRDFNLVFEPGVSNCYFEDVDAAWNCFLDGFGPLRVLYESLDEAGRLALKADVDAYHERYRVDAGLHIRREYLIVIGRRR
jgi:SAM-dependent methyltransferase